MSAAARSILAFGVYLAAGGLLLLFAPGLVRRLLGMRAAGETVWVRLCGMFFLDLAYYCIKAAQNEHLMFIRWSVFTRPFTLVFLAVFVGFGMVRPIILVLGFIDVLASLWTALALRKEPAASL
jgi:hypothetical protein